MTRSLVLFLAFGLLGAGCSLGGAKRVANEAVNTASQAGDIVSGAADLAIKAKADLDLAVSQARSVYNQALVEERALANGPCLANPLSALPDWVVDVAHRPRTAADDDPANQCSAYREGRARHFVELDTVGQLIRAE